MPEIRYTQHACEKFTILARHGFRVSPEQVENAVLSPIRVLAQPTGRWLAEGIVSETHMLRVIYRDEGLIRIIITFYPARRARYESQV
jgi:hypothetical protein